MKEVKIYVGQTLIDIALQELGDAERLFELAVLNNLEVTDTLPAVLLVPDVDPSKKKLVKLFANPMNKPASATGFSPGNDFWHFTPDTRPVVYQPESAIKQVPVLPGQTLIDIALQELGDCEQLFELAKMNNISATDDLAAGSLVFVPDYSLDKKELVKLFANPMNKPASSRSNITIPTGPEGIDYWGIEIDFVVS
jgi:hypothetical protein